MKKTQPGIPRGQALQFTRVFVWLDRPAKFSRVSLDRRTRAMLTRISRLNQDEKPHTKARIKVTVY